MYVYTLAQALFFVNIILWLIKFMSSSSCSIVGCMQPKLPPLSPRARAWIQVALLLGGVCAFGTYYQANQQSDGMLAFGNFVTLIFYLPLILLAAIVLFAGSAVNPKQAIMPKKKNSKVAVVILSAIILYLGGFIFWEQIGKWLFV